MNLNPKYLAACSLFMADDKEVRYFLRGVLLRNGRMTATNGHVLLECRDAGIEVDRDIIVELPREFVKVASLKKAPDRASAFVQDEAPAESGRKGPGVSIHIGCQTFWLPSIDGRFPDTDSVWPTDKPEISAAYDAKYLALFAKVGNLLGIESHVTFTPHGNSATVLEFVKDPDVRALVMPCRAP